MPILKKVSNHTCKPPSNPELSYGIGTIWCCNTCGKQARLEHSQKDGIIWVWITISKEYVFE